MPQLGFQLLHPGFQFMDGVSKGFDRVVCDGSHCGLDRIGRGLTKAEADLAG